MQHTAPKTKLSDQMKDEMNRKRLMMGPKRTDDKILISYLEWMEWVHKVNELEQELEHLRCTKH